MLLNILLQDTQYHVRRAEYDALYMQQKMEKEAIRTYHVVDSGATHEEAQIRMEK